MHRALWVALFSLALLSCEAKPTKAPEEPASDASLVQVPEAPPEIPASAQNPPSESELQPRDPKAYAITAEAELGTRKGDYGLAVGTVAPAFSLRDVHGELQASDTFAKGGETLLVFYRGGW